MSFSQSPHIIKSWLYSWKNTNGKIITTNLIPLQENYFGFFLFTEVQHKERRSTPLPSGETNSCFWLNVQFLSPLNTFDHKIIFIFVVTVWICIAVLRLKVIHYPEHNLMATVCVSTKCNSVTLWTWKPLVQPLVKLLSLPPQRWYVLTCKKD